MITRQRVFEFLLDEDTPMEERVSQKAIFEKKLEEIVDKFDDFDELEKPLTCIKNGLGCWYTCMLYPDEGWLCDECAVGHECGEEMLLPVVNSPRVGVCGYVG
jgi:hypothetical protein